ncbi:hypothetical protein KIN20_014614, partial [Parelaphostrongylus tenuis]
SDVVEVIEQQASSALLPGALISAILGQLTFSVTYEPLECQEITLDLSGWRSVRSFVFFSYVVEYLLSTPLCDLEDAVSVDIRRPSLLTAGEYWGGA